MEFINAKKALVALLEAEAAGRFNVVSYEPMPKNAKDFTGTNRSVKVFYSGGYFPKGDLSTPAMHDVRITLELVVSAASTVDLDVIGDPESTDSQKAQVIANISPAAMRADESYDEFISILWNILMEPKNRWLGSAKYVVGDRWVEKISKDRLIPVGEHCILTGYMELVFNVEEVSTGDTPFELEYIQTDFSPIDGDVVQKTTQKT